MLPSRVPLPRLLGLSRVLLPTPLVSLPGLSRGLHVDCPPTVPALTTSYVQGTSSTPFVLHTVGETLRRTVERFPDREALVFVERGLRKTFALFQEDVDAVAAGLLAIGLTRGDRLCSWGPNTYEWVLMQFATAKAGIILVCMNSANQAPEAEHVLRKVQCKAVVCPMHFKSHNYCDVLTQICPEISSSSPGNIQSSRFPELRSVVVLDGPQPGMFSLEELLQAGSSRHHQQLQDLQRKLSCDDPINILFTSGSTGFPKAATLTHFNILNNANLFGRRAEFDQRRDIRICVPVPMFHCFAAVIGGINMAVHGTTLVFPSAEYKLKAILETVQNERCTILYGTPTIFVDIITCQHLSEYDLSSLYGGVMGGAPCPSELLRDIFMMGIKEITFAYGCTELSPAVFSNQPRDSLERRTNTVGYILPHAEAKIVDPLTGEVLPLGELGELMVRGHCVMKGYWGDEDKTKECITADGWYRTGDIGSMDAYGYLQLKGRLKDLIIRGGENVYPAEIENTLQTHPKVKLVQVTGVQDFRMGEEICAFIELGGGEDCTEEEIRDYCRGKIASFKIPRYIFFVDSFPIGSSGKVLKSELRKRAEIQLGIKD